jgi:DNA-binding transcriptional LysR family regulator
MDWWRAAGIDWSGQLDDLVIPDPSLRLQAVVDGQGSALYDRLIDELAAGRLYQCRQVRLDDYGYHLVYRRAADTDSTIRIFRDWIMQLAQLG